jgi:hypothetical protein
MLNLSLYYYITMLVASHAAQLHPSVYAQHTNTLHHSCFRNLFSNCSNLVFIFIRLVSSFSQCGTSQGILYEVGCCRKGKCIWCPSMPYEHCKFCEVWLDAPFQALQLSSVGVALCPPAIFLVVRDSDSWCWSSGSSAMSLSVLHSCLISECFQQAFLIFQSAFRVLGFVNPERIEEVTIWMPQDDFLAPFYCFL